MAKKIIKKGKKPHKNQPTSKKYTKYKIDGDKITREKNCPRCGPGIFLMVTKDRKYCGRCHYTEFEGKKVEAKAKSSEESEPKEKKE